MNVTNRRELTVCDEQDAQLRENTERLEAQRGHKTGADLRQLNSTFYVSCVHFSNDFSPFFCITTIHILIKFI